MASRGLEFRFKKEDRCAIIEGRESIKQRSRGERPSLIFFEEFNDTVTPADEPGRVNCDRKNHQEED